MVHIYSGILLSNEKEQNNTNCNNIGGPRDYHTKWSKSDRGRQILWCHLYVECKKKNSTNELVYKAEIKSQLQETNLWLPGQKGGEG